MRGCPSASAPGRHPPSMITLVMSIAPQGLAGWLRQDQPHQGLGLLNPGRAGVVVLTIGSARYSWCIPCR